MTTLLLIRHGMNDWMRGRLAEWTPGVHLNDEGRKQAHTLGERLSTLPLAAIYSSLLERAVETARAIAAPHNLDFYPSGTCLPGGESLGEVQMRAITALDALRAQHPKEVIAVVGYAELIKLVTAYYIGMHIDLFQRLVINTASVTALAFQPMWPRLLAFHDTGSLDYIRPTQEEQTDQHTENQAQDVSPDQQAQARCNLVHFLCW